MTQKPRFSALPKETLHMVLYTLVMKQIEQKKQNTGLPVKPTPAQNS